MPRVPTRTREMSAECPYQKSGVLAREDRTVLKTRTLLYKLVPPHRIGFLRRFGLKTGIHFAHFVWNRVWFLRELRECMNVFIVSIPNE